MFTCGTSLGRMLLIYLHVVLALRQGCWYIYMKYLSWRKDVVAMFTCSTCLGGRMLLLCYMRYLPWRKDVVDMFTCGTCLGGRMLLICLHAVLVSEEGCC